MTPPLVLSLSQCTDPALVGGKAAGLGRLLAAGLPVPDGCCVTIRAYERALQAMGVAPEEHWRRAISRSGDDRREELRRCRELIRGASLEALDVLLQEALDRMTGGDGRRWVLRSSATNEDMVHASAAGLYRTILGARRAELARGITDIWASLWEEPVIEYFLRSGQAEMPPAMAVVVQPLVNATAAGVGSSIHPVTGRVRHVAINAVRGLGQPLVDGRLSAHQCVVDIQLSRVITRIRAEQQEWLRAGDDGVAMEPIPSADRGRPPLSDPQLLDVAEAAKRIEQVFQRPVDLEWAIADGRLWILQARPLTAVPTTVETTEEDCEWSRTNFKETLPELPSPMGLSFLERFMDVYILSHYRRLGCRIPPGLSSVRVIAGRPYLNVTLFHLLVGQLRGDPALNAEQMGGEVVQSAPPVEPLPWPTVARAGWLMWRELRRVLAQSTVSFVEMKALASRYSQERVRSLPLAEVQQHLDELGRWLDAREVTFGIAAGAGQCLQVFSRILPRWLGPDWRRLLNESLRGRGTVISAQQILRIADLVRMAREDAVVSKRFCEGWERGHYRRSFSGTPFLEAFDRYLEEYGHRGVGESDIMSLRLADQPEALLDVVKNQLDAAPTTPDELTRRQRAVRDQAWATIRARCGWRLDRWLIFQWWYRRLCRFFALREANRHHLMWYSLAARHLLLRLGELLADRGVFARGDDIFFLTLKELEVLNHPPAGGWAKVIEARRAEREQLKTVPAPDVIRGWEHLNERLLDQSADSDGILRGLPISSGIATGPVRFVRASSDWNRVRSGDIIVAPVIDPGIAPLFGIAAGLIVEMGGTLSHGAIIAREFGLPAIANVPRVMSLLSENERVTMDAAQGIVTRHCAPSGP